MILQDLETGDAASSTLQIIEMANDHSRSHPDRGVVVRAIEKN